MKKSADMTHTPTTSIPASAIRRVGIVGLGHMGGKFAENLIADGYQVTVYDRLAKHAAPFVALGATAASALADLAECEAVLTSVPDDNALTDVTLQNNGLIHVLAPGAIHISMSTVSPGLSRRLAQQHGLVGQDFVAAPVLGNPDLAHEGKLFVIAAGQSAAVEKVTQILSRLGQHVFVLGEDPGAANLLKVAANALTALTLQGMGEVLALLRKGGLESRTAFEVLTGSLFDGKVHKTYGGKIVESRYSPPGMTTPLALKDLRLALAEAEHNVVPMPATSLVHG